MKLSIMIPAYNEEKTISQLIKKVKNADIKNNEKEIIVVDDCSSDNTRKILSKEKGIKLIYHKKNSGKGSAIKTAIKESTGDILIIQDADLEYSPKDYLKLITPIINKKTKVVYGSRILNKNNKKGSFAFYLGGKSVTLFTNILFGSKLTDEPTCYKVFHKDLKKILLNASGNEFDWEPEITAKIIRSKYKILELPIQYFPRSKEEGKKINAKDGIITLWTLLKWRFKNLN